MANHNPLPPYEDYAHVKRRTKYTYNPVDMSALKNSDDPTAFQEHAGVEYEQGWLKQDVAPDAKFGVKCTFLVALWFLLSCCRSSSRGPRSLLQRTHRSLTRVISRRCTRGPSLW